MYARVTVPPPVEPLSLTEVKLNHKVEHTLDDELINALIKTAREYAENYCQLSLVTQTREVFYDVFYQNIELPFGPVTSLLALEYVDSQGVTTAIASTEYTLVNYRLPALISPAYSKYWPAARHQLNAVTARYVAGYAPLAGSPTDYTANVPPGIKTAMQLLIGHWYANREATAPGTLSNIPIAVDALLGSHRVSWL